MLTLGKGYLSRGHISRPGSYVSGQAATGQRERSDYLRVTGHPGVGHRQLTLRRRTRAALGTGNRHVGLQCLVPQSPQLKGPTSAFKGAK